MCSGPCSGENGVRHAAGVAIKHDVFDYANFFTLRGFDFGANKLAGLNVTSAAGSSALGLA